MQHSPRLDTARLVLRPPKLSDFDAYAAYWREPEVVRYISAAPVLREEAWEKLLRQVGLWELLGFGFFAVEDKASGCFVGSVGFQDLRRDLQPSIEGTLEAGWGLRPEYQGKGYAAEALQAALTWAGGAFPQLDYSCIIDPCNMASLRLAGRLGFIEDVRSTYHGKLVVILRRLRPSQGGPARSST